MAQSKSLHKKGGASVAGLRESKRFVVKVGSRLLVESTDLSTKEDWLQHVAEDIALCRERGQEVIVVSSGAVAMGCRALGHSRQGLKHVEQQQAAAAVGQGILLSAWRHVLARHHIQVGQALLSLEDTETRQRALNARDTFDALLSFGVVPIINENDTVATDEIRFGDNDRLAARIAQLVDADTLVLLSDVDGLYTANPQKHPHAQHIPVIEEITPAIENMATLSEHQGSTGGMVTKLMAARIAMGVGCRVVMASGHEAYPLRTIDDATRQKTWCLPKKDKNYGSYKKWLLGSIHARGTIRIDDGACHALQKGSSLLAAGVTDVEGEFKRGDLVNVMDTHGRRLAKGVSSYGSRDIVKIKGLRRHDIESVLGYSDCREVIHRNHMVLG